MATDKSEPRSGVIIAVAVVSLVTLGAVRAFLNTYFDTEARAEEQRKIGGLKPEALMSLRSDEARRLTTGPLPIASAMSELASRGRMGVGPEIMPSASRDVGPLQGWAKMPSVVPPGMTAPQPEIADGGAATTRDAGVSPSTKLPAAHKNTP